MGWWLAGIFSFEDNRLPEIICFIVRFLNNRCIKAHSVPDKSSHFQNAAIRTTFGTNHPVDYFVFHRFSESSSTDDLSTSYDTYGSTGCNYDSLKYRVDYAVTSPFRIDL